MKKLLSLVLFAVFFVMQSGTAVLASGAVLPNNTPVDIQASGNYYTSALAVGDTIEFATLNNITLNGKTVISAGTPVKATVKKVNKAGRIGIPGEVTIDDFYTTATNGAKVPLMGSIIKRGKSKMALSITLSLVVIPFFLLMKGKNASIEQGYQTTVYTTGTVSI